LQALQLFPAHEISIRETRAIHRDLDIKGG
jgi:hypothetical protein